MKVNFFKFVEGAVIPTRQNQSDAGLDLYAVEDFSIYPEKSEIVGLGIGWEPEDLEYLNVYAQIKAKSGLAFQKGVEVSTAGVIDQDYRGEWKIKIFNSSRKKIDFKKGNKIAQAVIILMPKFDIEEIDHSMIGQTDRGSNGFGSSGE